MTAIYKRELNGYFRSMTGYICIFAWLAIVGIYFFIINLVSGGTGFAASLNGCQIFYLFVIPILTMRSMSEDRKNKTDQLLLTAPASVTGVVLGKYLAMLTVYAIPCLVFCLYPIIIRISGTANLLADYASILAFFFMGSVIIAVGMLISSLTESQVLAAVGTYGILLLLLLWNSIVTIIPPTAGASFIGCILILILLCLLVHALAKNWRVALVAGLFGLAILIGLYLRDPALFANLLPTVFGSFDLTAPFFHFSSYSLFDMGGLLFYVSLDVLLVFITVQLVLRRRYC